MPTGIDTLLIKIQLYKSRHFLRQLLLRALLIHKSLPNYECANVFLFLSACSCSSTLISLKFIRRSCHTSKQVSTMPAFIIYTGIALKVMASLLIFKAYFYDNQ